MSSRIFAGAICLTLGMTGALAAQTASQNPTQPPQTPAASAQEQTVTFEGCLVRESDVPGRQPNVAEKQGVMEDFILANAKMIKGESAAGAAGATGTAGATGEAREAAGTSGVNKMFEVRGLDDSELQQYLGQRVEIVGKIDPSDLAERAREKASTTGEPAGDLPELHGTTIRKSSSTEPCTVK